MSLVWFNQLFWTFSNHSPCNTSSNHIKLPCTPGSLSHRGSRMFGRVQPPQIFTAGLDPCGWHCLCSVSRFYSVRPRCTAPLLYYGLSRFKRVEPPLTREITLFPIELSGSRRFISSNNPKLMLYPFTPAWTTSAGLVRVQKPKKGAQQSVETPRWKCVQLEFKNK